MARSWGNSMALKMTTTNEVRTNGIKIILYGISGAGKTSLLATVPRIIIVSAEKGLLSIAGTGIPVLEIESYEDLEEAYNWLINPANSHHFDSIGLDSLSEIGEVVLAKAKTVYKDQRQAYTDLADKTVGLIKKFRDIQGKNVILVCKVENYKEDLTGAVKYFPSMPGTKLTNRIPYLVDEVFYLGMKTDLQSGKTTRYIQTQPDHQVIAKDRSGRLNMYEPPHLGHIMNKILGAQNNG